VSWHFIVQLSQSLQKKTVVLSLVELVSLLVPSYRARLRQDVAQVNMSDVSLLCLFDISRRDIPTMDTGIHQRIGLQLL